MLVRHLHKKPKRQLLHAVAIRKAPIAEQIAVVPEFLGDPVRGHSCIELEISQRRRRVAKLAQRVSAGKRCS